MNTLTDKQQKRLERKKKKIMALQNLMQLNERQRKDKTESNISENAEHQLCENSSIPSAVDADKDFIEVTSKKKMSLLKDKGNNNNKKVQNVVEEEPLTKKPKVAADGVINSDNLLTDDEYKDLKRELRERRWQLENICKMRLKEMGQKALLTRMDDERTPLFLIDLQHLTMWSLLSKHSPCSPERWCHLDSIKHLRHTVIITFEGLSLYHYRLKEDEFGEISSLFDIHLEVIMPPTKEGRILEQLAEVPLTVAQAENLIDKYGSLEAAIEMNKDPTLIIKNIFPVANIANKVEADDLHEDDKFPRTKLLLSALQMVDEGYPMPLRGELNKHFSSYKYTKHQYDPVTNRSPMFGVDCEMCKTSLGFNELTRISIVNEKFETVYETLVRPANKIVDYLTPFSGITPEIMKTVTKTLNEVQKEIQALLPPDAILVGQSLNCDLNAMRMMHPYVIDTSVCFNITGVRRRKSKLRNLVLKYLQETIQERDGGHDSVEDSISSLKLVKMKLSNNVEFGDEVLIQKKRLHDIIRVASGDAIKNNLFAYVSKREKRTTIITAKPLTEELDGLLKKSQADDNSNDMTLNQHLLMPNNDEVVNKIKKKAKKNALTLGNINLTSEQLLPHNIDNTLKDVNKWIRKSWDALNHNTLFMVLMGNAAECSSGVAMLGFKRSLGNGVSNDETSTENNMDINGEGEGEGANKAAIIKDASNAC